MSNSSLLSRLADELAAFELKERSPKEFCAILVSCIEALENTPYATIKTMGEFRHRVEVGGYAEEEDCEFDRRALASTIREWFETLKKTEANQPLQRNASTGPVSDFESPARRG